MPCRSRARWLVLLFCTALILSACGSGGESGSAPLAQAVSAPGGFLEKAGSTIRSRWTAEGLKSFVPRGREKFTFPVPYRTEAVRLTIPNDCGGADCLWPLGGAYWRNMNNHVNSDKILIFLGLDPSRGGSGPTLLSYHKQSNEVTVQGPLFDSGHRLSRSSAEGWYFSATLPTAIYIDDGPKMLRYDVTAREEEVVFDVSNQFGMDRRIRRMSSSDDDRVHSATLHTASGEDLGCLVYFEPTKQFRFVAKAGEFHDCRVDRSGRWLLIQEELDGKDGLDNRFVDLSTGAEERILQELGAAAVEHYDVGHGYLVGHDRFNALPSASLTRNLDAFLAQGPVVHMDYNWELAQVRHISHTNAKPGIPKEQQYACGSNADRLAYAQNEILCFRLDGSLQQLVVAPVMMDLDASGGWGGDHDKLPKGNLDVTGRYFVWTANVGGNRLDAFVVKVPGHLLER